MDGIEVRGESGRSGTWSGDDLFVHGCWDGSGVVGGVSGGG